MDTSQLQALELLELIQRIGPWCEHMDPGHELNKLTAKKLSTELARRARNEWEWDVGLASDEISGRREIIADAHEALVHWACGF